MKEDQRTKLAAAWKTSAAKSKQLEELLAKRSGGVELGDIVFINIPEGHGMMWTVIAQDPEDAELFLCVPADHFDIAGTPDVRIPENALCGPLALRCGLSQWIPREMLNTRVGILEEWYLDRATDKMEEVFRGRLTGSPDQQEWDADPDLEERLSEVSSISMAVMDKVLDLSA